MNTNHNPNPQSLSFNEIIRRYKEMKESGKSVYFEPEEFTVIVNYYLKQEDFETADEVLDYALKLHPENPEILAIKGHSLIHDHKYDEALKILNQIPSTDRFEAAILKGELLIVQKKLKEAEEVFEQLYERESETYIALDIAELYITFRKKEEANKWLQIVGSDDTTDEEILDCYARYYYTFGEYKKAAEITQKLLDKDPYDVPNWQDIARCYIYMDETEKAINALEFAIAIDEDNLHTIELLGNCYLLSGNQEKAIEYLKKVEEKAPERTTPFLSLITAYMYLEDFEKVIEYSDKVIASKNLSKIDLCMTYQNRCNAFLHMGQPEKGRESIDKALELNKNSDLLYYMSGELYLIQGDMENAKEAFSQARKCSKSQAAILSDIGYSYYHHGHLQEALEYFREMERRYHDDMKDEHFFMLYCYYKAGNLDQAVSHLSRGMQKAPELLIRTESWLPAEDEKEVQGFLKKYVTRIVDIALGDEDLNNLMK